MMLGKKILFSCFSAFLCYQSYGLISQIMRSNPAEFEIIDTAAVAFLLNLFVTGIFAFVGFVFPTNKVLGTSYYRIANPNRLSRVYNLLQVELFRKLLLFFFWGRGKNRAKYFNGTRKGLTNFIYQSIQSEIGHLLAFISIGVVSLVLLFFQHFEMVFMATLINVIGNLYPIILQRHHRIRIDRILNSNKRTIPT